MRPEEVRALWRLLLLDGPRREGAQGRGEVSPGPAPAPAPAPGPPVVVLAPEELAAAIASAADAQKRAAAIHRCVKTHTCAVRVEGAKSRPTPSYPSDCHACLLTAQVPHSLPDCLPSTQDGV